MNKRRKPSNPRDDSSPPDDAWFAAARKFADNPDSPESLRLLSAINAALQPRMAAVEQLVEALVLQLEHPSEQSDAAVRAAIAHWQTATGATLTESLLNDFREDATTALQQRRNQPPAVESIIVGCDMTDTGYELGLHMDGIRGTWHRLWASIALRHWFGPSPEQVACVAAVRGQFEALLGRPMSTEEWGNLERHAMAHAAKLGHGRR